MFLSYFAADFIRAVGRQEYFPIITYLPAVTAVTLLGTLMLYYAPELYFSNRTDLVWIPVAARTLVGVAVAVLLIQPLGVWGIVAANGTAAMVSFVLFKAVGSRHFRYPAELPRLAFTVVLYLGLSIFVPSMWGGQGGWSLPVRLAAFAGFSLYILSSVLRMLKTEFSAPEGQSAAGSASP